MARRGRPPKSIKPIDRERIELADDVIKQLSYNSELSDEQINLLRSTLDSTLKSYDLERMTEEDINNRSIKDINAEAINAFVAAKKAEAKTSNTLYNYSNELAKCFLQVNKDYRQITADDIRQYMVFRKENDGLQLSTVQNIRMYLMSFYKWAIVEERITRNPMDKIGTVKKEKKVIETLTDEEVEIIRCACRNERDLAIVDLLSSSGMRVSELCNLNKKDVNFETGEIKVFGKGSKERICFMSGRCKVHLKWYLESRCDTNPSLFVTAKQPYNRLTKNGVEYILNQIGKLTGIDKDRLHLHPHKFRSTLASNMLNKGADIALVQGTLGFCLFLFSNEQKFTVNCFEFVKSYYPKQ